jgi:hypothetical protein
MTLKTKSKSKSKSKPKPRARARARAKGKSKNKVNYPTLNSHGARVQGWGTRDLSRGCPFLQDGVHGCG